MFPYFGTTVWYFLVTVVLVNCSSPSSSSICNNLNSEIVSKKCFAQLDSLCKQSDGLFLLWKMQDSSSNYPFPGLTYSDGIDLANFDECMSINTEGPEEVLGKFCTFSAVVLANPTESNQKPVNFEKAPQIKKVKSSIVTSVLSMCIPDACTPQEVGKYFIQGQIDPTTSAVFYDNSANCMTRETFSDYDWADYLFICGFAVIVLLMVVSTLYDLYLENMGQKPKDPVYLAFSILTNGRKLFTVTNRGNSQITCINGLRTISIMWIIAGHSWSLLYALPAINFAEIYNMTHTPLMQYISSAQIAVDTFFTISGFLLAFSFLKMTSSKSVKDQVLGVPMMIVHRYIRLTPALAAVYFLLITVFTKFGTGPLWVSLIQQGGKETCRKHWWSFFLYLQNYVNPKDYCLTPSWYLSADMQMFVLAPLVLIPTSYLVNVKRRGVALIGLVGATVFAVILPVIVHYGIDEIHYDYTTVDRLSVYLIGMILGAILRLYKDLPFYFTRLQNLAIWIVLLVIDLAWNIYYYDVNTYPDPTKIIVFFTLTRPIWAITIIWLIYSSHHGFGGVINWFLSWPLFQVGGRLSYCLYLTHGLTQILWAGQNRSQIHWSHFNGLYNWSSQFTLSLFLSIFWTLAFEAPMIGIERFIFSPRATGASKKGDKKIDSTGA